MRFTIRVKPGAKRDAVGGEHGGALIVSVKAPAVEGKANEAVCKVLAKALGVRSRDIVVVRGERAREKLIELADAPPGLGELLDSLRRS
ncbi:DUF167 domain-containing protein [Amycolatopsis cynarae]|uniref:UPF0235 protein ORV05_21875 n=1 Tax=Amycolatopsis cynarae TaxID=2995223 RepID=A0ABY7AYB3_9PSEU|nr:DUF167 domain-containing protein [Amycolatopsis sp. HUAS 11-8]WAL63646.1 DUF167 domain-containing protein [Amycolatopsis sp. HUAS 11-8]